MILDLEKFELKRRMHLESTSAFSQRQRTLRSHHPQMDFPKTPLWQTIQPSAVSESPTGLFAFFNKMDTGSILPFVWPQGHIAEETAAARALRESGPTCVFNH